ncbi:hypothetical protein CEUSTIGMA_g8251.t1 [Chlamydomonas eustigma]|uniref:DNA/RNA-binding protein Alba-like domain-containing protein n=1 Tax=Chlamydomonas eustigma TaxID=1157962 RepID=A0A250XCN1_9CHLO|nr:hypothetical protein CEUSTIGMA_g8251.t1 [Chlamydomonas eustigma]|eukprot:GAX80816.1 hypothetical protein CEUSTIGMA_g8251.t1 [Chlamydomonas eustigma]
MLRNVSIQQPRPHRLPRVPRNVTISALPSYPVEDRGSRVLISSKGSMWNYLQQSKVILQETGQVQISGVGLALPKLFTVTEVLKNDKLATQSNILTTMEVWTGPVEDTEFKPRVEVTLIKTPEFDSLIDQKCVEWEVIRQAWRDAKSK